jgi:hypothetical protein
MTIDNETVYWDMRKCLTGGLSIVHNRRNLAGIDTINRLKIGENGKIYRQKGTQPITHIIGVDFNSLYPTAFSSCKLSYMPDKLLMPGYYDRTITDKKQIRKHIAQRNGVFFVSVKGHCAINEETINFPPIIRNIDITTDRETIGDYMYDYMKAHDMKTDKKERKLTQLINSNGESKASERSEESKTSDRREDFMVFYCYYLWFLIDRCGFVIDDCQNLHIFTAHDNFNAFACQTMRRRQEAILNGDKIRDMFNKIALNGSYGYDIMNEAKYSKVKIVNRHKCFLAHMTPTFRHSEKLADDVYLVESVSKSFKCQTCIQVGVATLDIAKMLYLNFIYNFMYKCIDMDKCHFCEGDTDSMYWAVAG